MDSSLHLVPGRYKLPTAPGGSLRKDSPGLAKAETKFTATSALPVCVCVLCRLHICTCVFQCRVCHYKPGKGLTYYYIIKQLHCNCFSISFFTLQFCPFAHVSSVPFPELFDRFNPVCVLYF